MTDEAGAQADRDGHMDGPEHGPLAGITIDGVAHEVHRGRQGVAYLKQVGGVPPNYELDEVEAGRLVPLADDASVTIKGGEEFKSNLKIGTSS